jgi:hypothetical protein
LTALFTVANTAVALVAPDASQAETAKDLLTNSAWYCVSIVDNLLLGVVCKNISSPRRKLLDAVFTLAPTMDFIHDTKAGSKRRNSTRPGLRVI